MRAAAVAPLFYFGILISSIGSGTYAYALLAFLLKNGFSLADAALIMGLQRLLPTLVIGVWGHYTDRWSPRVTIVAAEALAAVLSLALLWVWQEGQTNLQLLTLLTVGRSIIVSFQLGSRAKITKILSGSTYAGNSRHAMWLNKATQGASLFSGALAWMFVTYSSLPAVILFDLATFALNGLLVFFLPAFATGDDSTADATEPMSWYSKFRDFFVFNRQVFLLDVVLFVGTGGLVAYAARVSGSEPGWTGLFVAAYGLAVWAAGFAERSFTAKLPSAPFWLAMGATFLALGQFQSPSATLLPVALVVSFAKDFCFWIIFHRLSAHVQASTPLKMMGSIASARNVLVVVVSAGMEIVVGAWTPFVSLPVESVLRALPLIAVGVFLFARTPVQESAKP